MLHSVPERVYQRVIHNADRDPVSGCLISRYSKGTHGYSQIGWCEEGKQHVTLGHRVVWIHQNGPIPDGMTVDHRQGLCSRMCVEIAHLRLIPNQENGRRNQGRDWPIGAICWRGHGPESLIRVKRGDKTGAGCRECARIRRKEYEVRYIAEHGRWP